MSGVHVDTWCGESVAWGVVVAHVPCQETRLLTDWRGCLVCDICDDDDDDGGHA